MTFTPSGNTFAQPAQHLVLVGARVTDVHEWPVGAVVCVHDRKMDEPWCLVASDATVLSDALLVVERAIGTDLGGKYVLVVGQADVVELRHVEIGAAEGELRVVTAGLRADERYVTNGMQRARPRLPVTPMMDGTAAPMGGTTAATSDTALAAASEAPRVAGGTARD